MWYKLCEQRKHYLHLENMSFDFLFSHKNIDYSHFSTSFGNVTFTTFFLSSSFQNVIKCVELHELTIERCNILTEEVSTYLQVLMRILLSMEKL